jgi:hypothetical protein
VWESVLKGVLVGVCWSVWECMGGSVGGCVGEMQFASKARVLQLKWCRGGHRCDIVAIAVFRAAVLSRAPSSRLFLIQTHALQTTTHICPRICMHTHTHADTYMHAHI